MERSIEGFGCAPSICPVDDPHRAVAHSKLATEKLILCQVEDADGSLEVSLGLHDSALVARPVGHVDQSSGSIQPPATHFTRVEREGDGVEGGRKNRAVTPKLHAGHRVGPAKANSDCQLLWSSSDRLMDRFQQFGDLADLQQAIGLLEELVGSTSVCDNRHRMGLMNLGVVFTYGFGHLGELSDLEHAISRHRNAVDVTPHGWLPSEACLSCQPRKMLNVSFQAPGGVE